MRELSNLHVLSLLKTLGNAFTKTPFYPYELEFKRESTERRKVLRHARGRVLNVGCGNDAIRAEVANQRQVQAYFGLDYPWPFFDFHQERGKRLFGETLSTSLLGNVAQIADVWGDGNRLPIQDGAVNTVLLFEVLEHIRTPTIFLGEMARVLTKNGKLLMSTPFVYPLHGTVGATKDFDFFRYTEFALRALLQQYGLAVIEFNASGGFGTALSMVAGHFIIRKCRDARTRAGVLLRGVLALPLFLVLNVGGRFLDMLGHEVVFADRYFVVAEKQ